MAIGLGLAYLLAIEGLLVRTLQGFSAGWVTSLEKFSAGQNASALLQSFGSPIPNPRATPPLVPAEQAVLVLAAYSLLFIALSVLTVRSRDVA